MLYLYSKCAFCGKIKSRYTSCVLYTLCISRTSFGAKLGLPDDFPPNCFPVTPTANENLGSGSRDLLDSGFKVGKNLQPVQKNYQQNIDKK